VLECWSAGCWYSVGTARAAITRLWVYCGVPVFGSLLEEVFSI
jgi:hypothetical protein